MTSTSDNDRLGNLTDSELALLRRALLAYNDADRDEWEDDRERLVNAVLEELTRRRDVR